MSIVKVLSIVAGVIVTLQLCDCNDSKKINSKDSVDVSSGNVANATEKTNSSESTTTTAPTLPSSIRIVDQKYHQNNSGEYKHEVLFSNGNWHAEIGQYEDRNGTEVFIVRGLFSYYTKEGTHNTTLYIVDEFGYHNVEVPPQLLAQDGEGTVDYRPDFESDPECTGFKDNYCIDPKLLQLLIG